MFDKKIYLGFCLVLFFALGSQVSAQHKESNDRRSCGVSPLICNVLTDDITVENEAAMVVAEVLPDANTDLEAYFSINKVLDQLITTSPGWSGGDPTQADRINLLASAMRGLTDSFNPPVSETGVNSVEGMIINIFNQGLLNRFDCSPVYDGFNFDPSACLASARKNPFSNIWMQTHNEWTPPGVPNMAQNGPSPEQLAGFQLDPNNIVDGRGYNGGLGPFEEYYRPIAIFNRFDLAANDYSTCGEYRIVFDNDAHWRFVLIFEAVIPNPRPEIGLQGCEPLVSVWDGVFANKTERLEVLEKVFFGGIAGYEPAIHFNHLGSQGGQLRVNSFITGGWALHDYVITDQGGVSKFYRIPIKNVPYHRYWQESVASIDPFLQSNFVSESAAFKDEFVAQIPSLYAELSWRGQIQEQDIINRTQMNSDLRFSEFRNRSHVLPLTTGPFEDDPLNLIDTNSAFYTAIQDRVQGLNFLSSQTLTAEHIINRANAMTCAGCHRTAVGKEIAPGIVWPTNTSTVGIESNFTHVELALTHGEKQKPSNIPVTEHQVLISQALDQYFLPHRRDEMGLFLCRSKQCRRMLCGDVNLDGVLDNADISILLAGDEILSGCQITQSDFNDNGVVDFSDIITLQNIVDSGLLPPVKKYLRKCSANLTLSPLSLQAKESVGYIGDVTQEELGQKVSINTTPEVATQNRLKYVHKLNGRTH